MRDADGYFWYKGRSDDLIKSSGFRIGPAEIEDCLLAHPAVAECAVIGKPDADRGQIVKALVRLRAGHQATDTLKATSPRMSAPALAPTRPRARSNSFPISR